MIHQVNNRIENPLLTDFLEEVCTYTKALFQSNRIGRVIGGRDCGKTTAVLEALHRLEKVGRTCYLKGHHDVRPYQLLRYIYSGITGNVVDHIPAEPLALQAAVIDAICAHHPGLIVYDVPGVIHGDLIDELLSLLDRFRGDRTIKTGFLLVSFDTLNPNFPCMEGKWRSSLMRRTLRAPNYTKHLDFCTILQGFDSRLSEFSSRMKAEDPVATKVCDQAIDATSGSIGKIDELAETIRTIRPKGTVSVGDLSEAAKLLMEP